MRSSSRISWRPSSSSGGSSTIAIAVIVVLGITAIGLLTRAAFTLGTNLVFGGDIPSVPCECPSCDQQIESIKAEEEASGAPNNLVPCPQPEPRSGWSFESSEPFKKYVFRELDRKAVDGLLAERRGWSSSQWESRALQLMTSNREGKYVITAVANMGHANFTLNWIASLLLHGYKKFVIFCLDFQLYELLIQKGFDNNVVIAPSGWTKLEIPPFEHEWGEENYYKLTEAKIRIQRELLYRNFWIVLSDVDLVFLSSHVVDHLDYIVGPYCSEAAPTQCFTDFVYMVDQDTDVNTGFFAARPTPMVKEAFDKTLVTIRKFRIDQLAFNYVIRTEMVVKYSKNFKALDKFLYANGFVYHKRGMSKRFNIIPLVVHANYLQGSKAKQAFLAKNGMWFID